MDGQEKLLDYETIKAAVAGLHRRASRWNKNNDQEGCTLLRRFAAITCTPPKQIHPLRVCTYFGG